MKKVVLAGAFFALNSVVAQADDLRFSFVDAGFFAGDSNDYEGDEARFRVRGSFAIGDVLYFPVAIESTAFESDDEDFSQSELVASAGIGARLNVSERMAFYGDASLAVQSISYDYDGGFDDDDEDTDGTGRSLRAGWRFQPAPLVDLTLEFSNRSIEQDYWDETLRRSLFSTQFNFSPMFGLGVEYHVDRYTYESDYFETNKISTRYVGAFFRVSFK